jgi:hypothetical protein
VGKESGLAPDVQQVLRQWDGVFHAEVHNGALSFMQEISGFQNGTVSFIGPTHNQDAHLST